jgi:hypothetical protein
MTPEARQRRLEALAREARGRAARLASELARRKDLPAAPGDLFVLAPTAELAVEWAVLDRNPGSGELLAVPADGRPFVGSADVAAVPDGSLVLRCRFGLWLPPALFKPDQRTGVVPADAVTAARHRWRQLEQGEVPSSPLTVEVDVDPEYQDWIRDVPERARALAARTRFDGMRPASPLGAVWPLRLAATLALVALGLAVWVVRLQQELAVLSEPELSVASADLHLGDDPRGITVLTVPPGESTVGLRLLVDPKLDIREGFVELVDHEDRLLFRSRRKRLPPSGELSLQVPRKLLTDGLYSIRLYAEKGARPLATERLRVETSE